MPTAATRTTRRGNHYKQTAEGRAFAVMLNVKKALIENAIVTSPAAIKGMQTTIGIIIREASEDKAADVIERAIREAERRGEQRAIRAHQAGRARR